VFIANFPWLLPFVRFFAQQSSFGLSWRYMEATAKKLVSERRSRGIGGKVCPILILNVTTVAWYAFDYQDEHTVHKITIIYSYH